MSSSVIPALIDAMVADFGALPALSGVEVWDGLPMTNAPGTYLFIGVDDPDVTKVSAADAEQEWPHATAQSRNEDGAITLACESIDGSGDLKACRDEVFRVVGVVLDRVRTTKTLGVPGVLWLNSTGLRLEQGQGDAGASALLTFRITYTARI